MKLKQNRPHRYTTWVVKGKSTFYFEEEMFQQESLQLFRF